MQERAKVLINDSWTSKSNDSLEHWFIVACISLFYGYYNGFWSWERRELCIPYNIRLSLRAHSFAVDWPVDSPLHYRINSFIIYWKSLSAEIFLVTYGVKVSKSSVHKHYSLIPPSINIYSLFYFVCRTKKKKK